MADQSNIWFALASDGELYCLCDCGDMDAAEESAADLGIEAVWIADEAAARQWQARLNLNLPANLDERIQPSYIVADHEADEGSGWEHDFGMGNVTVRFAYDLNTHDLVAASLLLAGLWKPASLVELRDLEDSLQNANADALDDPAGWGLIQTDTLPSWAGPIKPEGERPLLPYTAYITHTCEYRVDVEARDKAHARLLLDAALRDKAIEEIGDLRDSSTDVWDITLPFRWEPPVADEAEPDTDPSRETRET